MEIIEYNGWMRSIQYSIDDQVFEHFPAFIRGVLVAREVSNLISPEALIEILRGEEKRLLGKLDKGNIAQHPRIDNWREAFRSLGIKPSEYRSSVEALVRRVMNGHQIPAINAIVDICSIISLRYLIPAGSHALDRVKSDITLRHASGREIFHPLGSTESEHPEPDEIIFAEENEVLTRRWVWRQSTHTLTELDSRHIAVNLDALPPVDKEEIHKAGNELADLVGGFCGGETELFVLDQTNPKIILQN